MLVPLIQLYVGWLLAGMWEKVSKKEFNTEDDWLKEDNTIEINNKWITTDWKKTIQLKLIVNMCRQKFKVMFCRYRIHC